MKLHVMALAAAALPLAGCENDAASYQSGGATDPALTLIREQRWFWQQAAEVAVVVARAPDCQRRHALAPAPAAQARVDIYGLGDNRYLLRAGQNWYVADGQNCALASVAAPAGAEGVVPIGVFDRAGGKLKFTPAAPPQTK